MGNLYLLLSFAVNLKLLLNESLFKNSETIKALQFICKLYLLRSISENRQKKRVRQTLKVFFFLLEINQAQKGVSLGHFVHIC